MMSAFLLLPFLDPEGRSQKATLVVVLVVVFISSLTSKGPNIPKAFSIRSGAQRNCAYTFVLTLPIDDRSTVSDFSLIF